MREADFGQEVRDKKNVRTALCSSLPYQPPQNPRGNGIMLLSIICVTTIHMDGNEAWNTTVILNVGMPCRRFSSVTRARTLTSSANLQATSKARVMMSGGTSPTCKAAMTGYA